MREETGRTRDDVVASRLMSRSKLESIEHGRTMVRPGDAYELGRLYETDAEELEALRDRRPPLRLRIVLGEAALRLWVGGPEAMARQHARLLREVRREHLDLRVLTEEAGPHRGLRGNFAIMDFDDPEDPSVVHLEAHTRARFEDQEADVEAYRGRFRGLRALATPLEEHLT